jgi:hypothetical protein
VGSVSELESNPATDTGTTRFKVGQCANPRGRASRKARIAAKMRELAGPLGGLDGMDAVALTLLEQAASVAISTPSKSEDAVRGANSVSRLLGIIERRVGKAKPSNGFGRLRARP